MIHSKDLRKKFLQFFAEKQHAIIASAPVVPENDPTVLFNTAGMQPLAPYFMGEKHPEGTRIANIQKCIRTNDLEEVGDDTHCTFFEMMGNWSFGDYFKEETITWSFEFLTSPKYLNIPIDQLAVTVFAGDDDAQRDTISSDLWEKLGIPKERISFLGKKDNWWAAGATGPCGTDSEIFYWVGQGTPPIHSNVENDELSWMEIWNNVFMEFNRNADNSLTELPSKNVDTGMGFERVCTVLNGHKSVYDTDIFADMLQKLEEISGKKYQSGIVINEDNLHDSDSTIQTIKRMRIIVDHIRTAVIMLSDGVRPSNVDQGYILRRLIRRAIRSAHQLGIEQSFAVKLGQCVIEKFSEIYLNIDKNKAIILEELTQEEGKFRKTLIQGLKEFEKLLRGFAIALERSGKKITTISGDKAFKLYDTYGFPLEMTQELAKEHSLEVDAAGFALAYKKHQELSKQGSEKKFKGGLADDSQEVTAYHTATHLLHQALKDVLGDHVEQKGSNITSERLRFDFSHSEKLTDEQKEEVTQLVNTQIAKSLPITCTEMTVDQAKSEGAIGLFGDKYDEKIKVYTIEGFSKEICGGPHVENTKELGVFKIKKEQASSAGIRRIKAILTK